MRFLWRRALCRLRAPGRPWRVTRGGPGRPRARLWRGAGVGGRAGGDAARPGRPARFCSGPAGRRAAWPPASVVTAAAPRLRAPGRTPASTERPCPTGPLNTSDAQFPLSGAYDLEGRRGTHVIPIRCSVTCHGLESVPGWARRASREGLPASDHAQRASRSWPARPRGERRLFACPGPATEGRRRLW